MKISILIILVVIAFLILFNSSNRENFTSLNPIITQADYDSLLNNRTPTANATILTNWWNKNTTMSIYDLPAFAYNLQHYGTIVPSLSGPPNVDDFLRQIITTLDNGNQDQLEVVYNDYKAGLNSSTSWFSNAIYTYYFGTAPPAPPAPPAPSISGNTSSTIVPPKKSTSPCYPEFKSIPGGTMEFRCFNS